MIETYEVRWSPDTHYTDDYVLRNVVEAETADEAARATTLDAQSGGMIVVYKTYTTDDGTIKTGNPIRRYVPDDYGYTWVPMTMQGGCPPIAAYWSDGASATGLVRMMAGEMIRSSRVIYRPYTLPPDRLSAEDEAAIAQAMARICDRFYRDWCGWRDEYIKKGQMGW
jgi:hypothetical protein